MNTTLLIFLGAGFGGVLRYWVSNGIYLLLGRQFPYGTLVVNISGCFLMGLLFVLTVERFDSIASELRALLLIGLLGGYTTFSSFSIETINLFESGHWGSAIINIVLSTILCIAAAWLGIIGRKDAMKTIDVLMIRIYITESSHLLNQIVNYLKKDVKIRGVTVFRAISGFGETGSHTTSLVDLSLDLPLIVEFFDNNRSKIEKALDHLGTIVKPEHIVLWEAKANS